MRAYNGAGPVAVAYADDVARPGPRLAANRGARPIGGARLAAARRWSGRSAARQLAVLRAALVGGLPPGHRHRRPDRHARSSPPTQGRVSARPEHRRLGRLRQLHLPAAHAPASSTCYAHQARVLVRPGQLVARGQPIGTSDCTGRCYGTHLHFEVRVDGRVVCPARYLAASPRVDVRARIARLMTAHAHASPALALAARWRPAAVQNPYDQTAPAARDDARRRSRAGAPGPRPAADRPRRRDRAASARATARRVRGALGQLGLAHRRRPAARARAAGRPARSPASCAPAHAPRASDASLRRDTPGVARYGRRDRPARRRAAAPRGLVVTREQTYTAGRADLGGRRYRVYHVSPDRHLERLGGERMAAAAIAARSTPRRAARTPRRQRAGALAFDELGGPLVAVCGLAGGAGTSTLALLLARQAAASERGADPAHRGRPAATAGLAVARRPRDAASADRARRQLADRRRPDATTFLELEPGLRLIARRSRAAARPPTAAVCVRCSARRAPHTAS